MTFIDVKKIVTPFKLSLIQFIKKERKMWNQKFLSVKPRSNYFTSQSNNTFLLPLIRSLSLVHPQYEAFKQTITFPILSIETKKISEYQFRTRVLIPEEDIFIPFAFPLSSRN